MLFSNSHMFFRTKRMPDDAASTENFVSHMTWDGVASRIEQGALAILPIGAAAKQHGWHLPMNTDEIQARWLSAEIARKVDALIWPPLSYGYYPAFVAYAGSVSLMEKTFISTVHEMMLGLLAQGCPGIVVLDTGISTIAPVDLAIAKLKSPLALHLKIHDGARYRRAVETLTEQKHGSHADELETSLMLAIAADRVDMPRAQASPALQREIAGPLSPIDTASPNYSRSGSYGDPTLATLTKGEALRDAMAADACEQVMHFASGLKGDVQAPSQHTRSHS